MMIGFDTTKSGLLTDFQAGKLHHAILLHGKKGIGKASFAKSFALEIIGGNANSNSSPNLLYIAKQEGKRDIVVDQIREISGFVNQTAAIFAKKFIIIDTLDHLNKAASNALLKILEEPQTNNQLLLTCNNLGKLLPTIKSRCQILKIQDLNFAEFSQILHQKNPSFLPKISDEKMALLGEICDNSPAQAILEGEELIDLYEEFLNSLKKQKISENLTKKIADKNFNFENFIEMIMFFLNRLATNKTNFYFCEEEIFEGLRNKFSMPQIFDLYDKISDSLVKTKILNLDKKLCLINVFNRICW